MSIDGAVAEREFFHWTTAEFLKAANNAATIEFTTTPTTSWYWRKKLASRSWAVEAVGDVLAHGKYTSELLKEHVFEEVRAAEFPQRPTRRRAMFLLDADLDPKAYATAMKLPMNYLYRVTVRAGRLHRADARALDCNASLHAEMVTKAREYWLHVAAPSLASEVLFEGECTMQHVPRP